MDITGQALQTVVLKEHFSYLLMSMSQYLPGLYVNMASDYG